MKTVLHVCELSRWRLALANAENLVAYCREEMLPCSIEIVANGEAVILLAAHVAARSGMEGDVRRLVADGVQIVACNNSLTGFEIDPSKLLDCVEVVPAGIVELIAKQEEGCAYIRP